MDNLSQTDVILSKYRFIPHNFRCDAWWNLWSSGSYGSLDSQNKMALLSMCRRRLCRILTSIERNTIAIEPQSFAAGITAICLAYGWDWLGVIGPLIHGESKSQATRSSSDHVGLLRTLSTIDTQKSKLGVCLVLEVLAKLMVGENSSWEFPKVGVRLILEMRLILETRRYVKLCASFQSHWWIQTGVTVWKFSVWVKIGDFLSPVTSKFDRWPWKTIGHISATSSFVLHFIAIYQFKMELQSGNAKFGSKSAIFLPSVTLKFDGWPWKTIGHLFHATSSFVYHFIAFCEIKMKLQSGNTQFGSKSAIFCPMTLKFDRWPWKIIGLLFYSTSSLMHHFIGICEFKMELHSGNAQFGSKLAIFCPAWPWNLTDDLDKQ